MTNTMNIIENERYYSEKAARIRRRRERELRIHILMLSAVIICIMIIAAIWFSKIKASAETENNAAKEYTCIIVGYGESLYDIAEKYDDPVYYADKDTYIDEVRYINHIPELSDVKPGDYIIVPYYKR